MKKVSLALLVSLFAATAYAQTDRGVTMSTDPAKAADIEQRAQALEAAQSEAPATPSHAPAKHHKAAKQHKGGHAQHASEAEATALSATSQ
ncbi:MULTISPECIES: hypothetical protein [Burkholderiaceae]|uniref:hypothetical protein n=1 Tax=Burkholderiaceae TaxID=119060 RepID=UPI000967D54A|nr:MULTISPECIES: hypothetical protein [Burkholderiaceae]MCF2133659.1 hypothetical protein [Mycetohabitans sp. B3]MCG1018335.1 hypothetical protein [Mycetohabitans sp. B4]MCG1039211.1 hypothetical protein [Mycetohabitans sp. B7]SIT66536.1 hypothetical protein SAMN04487768_0897 [Burkholderia sp. b13]SIT67860.1 hypothetical protein SAMN04487769_1194 [Burkholderia sp. b14]